MKKINLITAIFYALIILFIVTVGEILAPISMSIKQTLFPLVAVFAVIFFLLGLKLIFLTIKTKTKGKYGKFLILTGASAAGFFVSVLLHNFLYGLGVITQKIIVLHYLFEFLHAAFFVIAILVCPLGFLVGVVGGIITAPPKKKK